MGTFTDKLMAAITIMESEGSYRSMEREIAAAPGVLKLWQLHEAKRSMVVFTGAPKDRFHEIMRDGLVVGAEAISSVANMAGGRYVKGIYVGDVALAAGYAIGVHHYGYSFPGHLYEIDLTDADVALDTDAFISLVIRARAGSKKARELLGDDPLVDRFINREIELNDVGSPLDDQEFDRFVSLLHKLGMLQLLGLYSGLIVRTNIGPEAIRAVYLVVPAGGERFGAKAALVKEVVRGAGDLTVGQVIQLPEPESVDSDPIGV